MSRCVLALGAFLYAALAASACDYGQRATCGAYQQQQFAPAAYAPPILQAPLATVVVPTVQSSVYAQASFAQVSYAPPVIVREREIVRVRDARRVRDVGGNGGRAVRQIGLFNFAR